MLSVWVWMVLDSTSSKPKIYRDKLTSLTPKLIRCCLPTFCVSSTCRRLTIVPSITHQHGWVYYEERCHYVEAGCWLRMTSSTFSKAPRKDVYQRKTLRLHTSDVNVDIEQFVHWMQDPPSCSSDINSKHAEDRDLEECINGRLPPTKMNGSGYSTPIQLLQIL